MIKTKQPITSINGFSIGDKVRLKDGDGREHIIKSFSIEGLNEFFFEVQFEDGSWTMLDNIELLPFNLDEAAIDFADNARKQLYSKDYAIASIADYDHGCIDGFKAGAEWMIGQWVSYNTTISADKTIPVLPMKDVSDMGLDYGDNVTVKLCKKQ